MAQGQKREQWYDYSEAEGFDDIDRLSGGRLRTTIYRTRLSAFMPVDLRIPWSEEMMISDGLGGAEMVFQPRVEMIQQIREAYEAEVRAGMRWAKKLWSTCKGYVWDGESQDHMGYQVECGIIALEDRLMKALEKRKGMNTTTRFRLSYYESGKAADISQVQDWLVPESDNDKRIVSDYFKMQGREFQQYAYSQMIHEVFMEKIDMLTGMIVKLMDDAGYGKEAEDLCAAEYNRLRTQARHEQERRVKR